MPTTTRTLLDMRGKTITTFIAYETFRQLADLADGESLELVTDALSQKGVEILTASDPDAGFELFLRARPQVVLLDLVMPKMSGLEVLELVKRDPRLSSIPVLILSNLGQDGDIQRLQSSFINGVKHLPVSFTPGKPVGR